MSRLRVDAVEVQRHDDVPAQFLWGGRIYKVREVLSRWTESGGWWRSAGVLALSAGDGEADPLAPLRTSPIPSSPKWAQRAWGEPAPDVGAVVGPASVDDGEQDWFRVEAGCPPFSGPSSAGTGVYDLCFSWSSGRWTLARVLD
ncbi:MAG: hypothetical protein JWN08_2155 [Frankiales bacterium]|nr:hypothetical protein [Frankiales bacterium]